MVSKLGLKAKKTLEALVEEINEKLAAAWNEEIEGEFGFSKRQRRLVREALVHGREHNLRPAKRLRGSFVYYAFLLSGKEVDERVWGAVLAVEIVHTALLIHDDFMDRDDVRRGGPTTHRFFEQEYGASEHHGAALAVTVGDALLCWGFELLHECGSGVATRQMLRGILNTAHGQFYDVMLEVKRDWGEEDVIVLHRAKTGIYTYENPLLIGADLAGLSLEAREVLRDYATDGGVAFQLQDDILGVYGSPEKTGKSADSDLKQGKCTLMVLKAFELGDENQQAAVRKVWGNMGATGEELNRAKKAMRECGAYEYNKEAAVEYAKKAARTAERLRKLNLEGEAIDYIQGVAEYMVTREV